MLCLTLEGKWNCGTLGNSLRVHTGLQRDHSIVLVEEEKVHLISEEVMSRCVTKRETAVVRVFFFRLMSSESVAFAVVFCCLVFSMLDSFFYFSDGIEIQKMRWVLVPSRQTRNSKDPPDHFW